MVYQPVNFHPLSIPGLKRKAAATERDVNAAQDSITALQGDVERLLILTEALWTLLKRQQKLDDSVLVKLIEEIDLRDGQLDGRVAGTVKECPSCKRPWEASEISVSFVACRSR